MENGGNIVSCLTPNDYYWAFSHYSKAFGSQERKREREREKKASYEGLAGFYDWLLLYPSALKLHAKLPLKSFV